MYYTYKNAPLRPEGYRASRKSISPLSWARAYIPTYTHVRFLDARVGLQSISLKIEGDWTYTEKNRLSVFSVA